MSDKQRLKGVHAGHGTGSFIVQRATAVAVLFLGPWFIIGMALAARVGGEGPLAFLSTPANKGLTALFLIAAAWHMQIGMREIIEDYIAKTGTRKILEALNIAVTALAALAGVYALVQLNSGV